VVLSLMVLVSLRLKGKGELICGKGGRHREGMKAICRVVMVSRADCLGLLF